MSLLTLREQELVALRVAMGSNCVSCIEFHVPSSKSAGLIHAPIAEAIRLADKTRQIPARKTLDTAFGLLGQSTSAAPAKSPAVASVHSQRRQPWTGCLT